MRIVEQTPTRLKLQSGKITGRLPLFLIAISVGLPLLVLPIYLSFLGYVLLTDGWSLKVSAGKGTLLTCDRQESPQVTCELTAFDWRREQITEISRGKLQSAEVRVQSNRDGYRSRVVLITEDGELPLTNYLSTGERQKHRDAERINAFVSDPEQTALIIPSNYRWSTFFQGVIYICIGSILIGGSAYSIFAIGRLALKKEIQTAFIFDGFSNRLYSHRVSIFKLTVEEYSLNAIEAAKFIEAIDDEGEKYYSAQLILSSGQTISLPLSDSDPARNMIVRSINQFLRCHAR